MKSACPSLCTLKRARTPACTLMHASSASTHFARLPHTCEQRPPTRQSTHTCVGTPTSPLDPKPDACVAADHSPRLGLWRRECLQNNGCHLISGHALLLGPLGSCLDLHMGPASDRRQHEHDQQAQQDSVGDHQHCTWSGIASGGHRIGFYSPRCVHVGYSLDPDNSSAAPCTSAFLLTVLIRVPYSSFAADGIFSSS